MLNSECVTASDVPLKALRKSCRVVDTAEVLLCGSSN